MGPAILRGSMSIPRELVDEQRVCDQLTINYQSLGAEEPTEIQAYELTDSHILVPRQFGIRLCDSLGIEYEDQTSVGVKASFPRIPQPRDYQVEPLQDIMDAFQRRYDFVFRARTGWGKTIGSLIIAARLGRSTLVLVDQENLKEGWEKTLTDPKLFGFKPNQIGVIQGKKCDYQGKAVTIAMMQTLCRKEYPPELYEYFGTIIVDEVHVIGAPTFSTILPKLNAAYRFGVSATPKRRDTLQKLIESNLGKVAVYVADEHENSAVYVADHPTVYSAYANRAKKMGRFISEIAEDGSRNLLIAELAAYLYDTGRDTLILSDRTEQLRHLESLLYYLGIPEDELGCYTGYRLFYGYAKDPTPLRRPKNLVKHSGDESTKPGVYYTPVSLQLISKRAKSADLKRIKETARIINATYGKFSKGVDEPRLNGGVDATPRARAEQEQGRILRKVEGKLKSIWFTVADTSSYRSLHALLRRLIDYEKNNSTVSRWSFEEGKQECDLTELETELEREVKRLQGIQIKTGKDGINTLVTKRDQIESVKQRVAATKAKLHGSRALPTGSAARASKGKSLSRGWTTLSKSSPSPYRKRRQL